MGNIETPNAAGAVGSGVEPVAKSAIDALLPLPEQKVCAVLLVASAQYQKGLRTDYQRPTPPAACDRNVLSAQCKLCSCNLAYDAPTNGGTTQPGDQPQA